jgi:hypothetical protein
MSGWFSAPADILQNLKLRKPQADALLKQLARQWEEEFDLLCLAHGVKR